MTVTAGRHSAPNDQDTFVQLAVDRIVVAGLNPRQTFDEEALAELAESIRQHGLLEPLVVRPKIEDDRHARDETHRHLFELIAGERRLRAAKLAGLTRVSVRVVQVDDRTAHELALVENLVREDLDPIETAEGYRKLADLGVKQAEIGRRVGRSQPLVANTMRLLQLPADVQERIRKGELTTAHGVSLARFHEFPGVVSAIAELAVTRTMTAKEMQDGIPFAWELRTRGLIRDVGERHDFLKAHCFKCPFGAYRKQNDYIGTCLKPEHFDELKAAQQAEAEREVRAKIAEVRGEPPAATESLVVADSLNYDQYVELTYGKAPPGCKLAECPSYQQGIRYGRPATLCLDPKCHRRLETNQTKLENRTRKQAIVARAKALLAATKPLTEIGPREAAVLAAYCLSQADKDTIPLVLAARGIPQSAHKKPYSAAEAKTLFDEYAKLDPHALLLAALEALVQGEAARDLDNKSVYGEANLHAGEWYVAPMPEPAIEVEASEPAVEMPKL